MTKITEERATGSWCGHSEVPTLVKTVWQSAYASQGCDANGASVFIGVPIKRAQHAPTALPANGAKTATEPTQ